jgi:general secretion pathway protein A
MYEKFFQLEKAPFSTVPDPNCVHMVGQHADAISGLVYGVMSHKGYVVLTGEAGLGKTTALRVMSQLLSDANVQLSLILNPILTAPEFLEMLMLNFGIQQVPVSKAQRLKMLQEFLIRSDHEGKVSALIVDEAHRLSADLLEEVRLLGNFEAADHKLLQIVLVGQDELNDRLNLPELWQLKQRMVVRMSLRRLDRDAVEPYLRFRWAKAGGANSIPFTAQAIDAIAAWSHGIPRLINAVCDNALLIAFSKKTETVDVQQIRAACTELNLPTAAVKPRLEPSATRAAASRPVQHQIPVAQRGAERHAIPQFWQYSGPSLLEKWLPLSEDISDDIREPRETAGHAPAANQEEQRRLVPRETDRKQFPTLNTAEVPWNSLRLFTAIGQQRQTHFLRPIVLVITGVIALAGITVYLLPGRRLAASVESTPLAARPWLYVGVKRQGAGLVDIQWDPKSAAVAQAKAGRIVITEGNQQPRIVALEPDQLNIGHLSYPFLAERGEFRLEVVDRSGATTTESVLAFSSKMPPAGIRQSQTSKAESIPTTSTDSDGLRLARTSGPSPGVSGATTLPSNAGRTATLNNLLAHDNPSSLPVNEPPVTNQVWIGGDVQAANLIRRIPPLYPPSAVLTHVEGNVRLSALIGKDGRVRNLNVIGGTPGLIQSALDAVKQWIYRPTLFNGQPVEVNTEIDVDFTLDP